MQGKPSCSKSTLLLQKATCSVNICNFISQALIRQMVFIVVFKTLFYIAWHFLPANGWDFLWILQISQEILVTIFWIQQDQHSQTCHHWICTICEILMYWPQSIAFSCTKLLSTLYMYININIYIYTHTQVEKECQNKHVFQWLTF